VTDLPDARKEIAKYLDLGGIIIGEQKFGVECDSAESQLLYALAAEKLLGAPVESGRLFYATQRGEYMHALISATPQARLFLARLVENIDSAIATGFLPPAPQKDVCGMCDYRVACGPYEERRVGSFKDRRDERLETLTEIRAMI
jgi:CRISPR/Cas system-associated exonuclease Cas4 (RecB family)